MPITSSEVQDVVLREDDFGHEMRVGGILKEVQAPQSAFIKARVSRPDHGGTYTDQVTGKTRQFDYRCQISKGYDSLQSILLAIECKNLNPDLPLVVCGRQRNEKESYHLFMVRDVEEQLIVGKVEGLNSLYETRAFVGKSLLRLKIKDKKLSGDGDSEIYDKWSQALASSRDLVDGFIFSLKPSNHNRRAFVMPIVVVPDNALWIVSYDDNGTLQDGPKQVDQCEFYVDHKLSINVTNLNFVQTHIHFATLKGLSKMLTEFMDGDFYKWDKVFSAAASKIYPI